MRKTKYTEPVVKSTADGRVVNGRRATETKSKSYSPNNIKSFTNKKVTGDPGNYKRRKTLNSILKGNTTRNKNGTGMVTPQGERKRKYGN